MIIRQGIDSKALLVTFIRKLPQLFLLAVAGAVFGSGLHLLITLYSTREAVYVQETEYYIDFADGRLEAKDYYNDYTWNDVIASDLILGRMMEELGTDYDRDTVRQMLRADILSDVRYLTITVRGKDDNQVYAVSNAFCNVIAVFGGSMEEFDSIYKVKDSGIKKEHPSLFVWRTALLGMVIFVGVGIFWIALAFLTGDRFYTKTDVMKFLELPALGLLYQNGNEKSGKQERRLLEGLEELLKSNKKIYLLDAADGQDAERFVKRLTELGAAIDLEALLPCERYGTGKDAVILVVVPFGRVYREKITDEINNAVMHGGNISGAVLTECDRHWTDMYYGKGVKA